MKSKDRGFVSIWLVVMIVAALAIAGGATYAVKHKAKVASEIKTDSGLEPSAAVDKKGNKDDQPAEVNFDTSSTVQTETSISTGTGVATGAGAAAGVSVNVGGQTTTQSETPSSACGEMIVSLESALGFDLIQTNLAGEARYGQRVCTYHFLSTGDEYVANSFPAKIDAFLIGRGWVRNHQFAADGVLGGSFLLEKNGVGAMVSHRWVNAGELCPVDLFNCNITKDQKRYEVTIDIQAK